VILRHAPLLILTLIPVLQSAAQQPRIPPPGARGAPLAGPLVRIASQHAGPEGIWLRVAPPERPRYPDGAPVVVHVPGGLGPGGVGTAPARLGDFGFIDIAFLFPGGESGPPVDGKPLRSGGTYDSRGPASVRALADVIAFALGRTRSLEGKTIQDYAGQIKVLTGNVGVIGWSLGGTTIAATLGMHGKELSGLRWYASHESPYGEGIIDGEFGAWDRPNPFYDANTGKLDLSTLRYGKDLPVMSAGRMLEGAQQLRGALFLDGNGNGAFEPASDFAFSGIYLPGPPPNVFYSPMLTRAARGQKVFGAEWPAHIATLEKAEECWRLRDGVSHIPGAVKNLPDLALIVFAGAKDHVQATADHRHILLQYGGFQQAGARWTRLNPDARYVEMVLGKKVPSEVQNPAGAKFDRANIRSAVMPEPEDGGPSDPEALTAAACELADRTKKGDWKPTLSALLFPDAPRRTRAERPPRGEARQPRIAVVFNMHLDPVVTPDPERSRAELTRRRDNMLWLEQMLSGVPADKRPRVNIQISGTQGEFYLQDEAGLEMLRRLWRQGHELGTHFHLNIYLGEAWRWDQLRPSRIPAKPPLPPGEILTPGILPEPNTIEEVRRLWRDNFRFTDPLIAKVTGVSGQAELRKINNNGEFFLPNGMDGKDVLFKEYGITVQTGGRNELFNMIFDHDVFNAWRPGTKHELGEDPKNKAYVCVPQLAVPGNIRPHQGILQDLSIPALQRRFLQIVMERREHERLGLPPKAWTFGWTVHDFDIPPGEGPMRRMSQRKNLEKLVAWINENFVPDSARWDTPNGVANSFYELEARQPGASQFQYPHRKPDWEAYPYRLKGAAKTLPGSHFLRALPEGQTRGMRVFELARVRPGAEWFTDQNNEVQVKGETTRLFLAWSDAGRQVLDLSRYAKGKGRLVRGASGESSVVELTAVPVGEEPVIVEVE